MILFSNRLWWLASIRIARLTGLNTRRCNLAIKSEQWQNRRHVGHKLLNEQALSWQKEVGCDLTQIILNQYQYVCTYAYDSCECMHGAYTNRWLIIEWKSAPWKKGWLGEF